MEFEVGALCYSAILMHLDGIKHSAKQLDLPVGISTNIVKDDRDLALIPFTIIVEEIGDKGFFKEKKKTFKITVNVEEVKDATSDKNISTPVI